MRGSEPDRDGRILVVIQLDGGNDGINTVVPYKDDGYKKHRRDLRLPSSELIKLDERTGIGLNPAMKAWAKLFEDGHLAVIHGVGYPNPSRSHFESMAVWQSAQPSDSEPRPLWLAWARPGHGAARDGGSPGAIFLSRSDLPLAIRGRRAMATALTKPGDFMLDRDADPRGDGFLNGETASFVQRRATRRLRLRRSNGGDGALDRGGVSYPRTALAERLSLVATLIRAGLGSRVYYAIQSGYDTHSVQAAQHAGLLTDLADAVRAFHDDLRGARLDDRVAVLCFSEFGRRVEENGSSGTDHGTAGPVFLVGSRVQGGLVGTAPSLVDLDPEGDLKMTVDFRGIYASVLEEWLGIPAQAIVGKSYAALPLFKV